MNTTADQRFFAALAKICAQVLGPDAPCTRAAQAAVDTPGPEQFQAARTLLHALPPKDLDRVMAAQHSMMRMDISAVWDQMPGAPASRRPN